jgi:hypothetical protein
MPIDFQQVISTTAGAFGEGLKFFAGKGMVNNALTEIVKKLNEHGIDYAVIGAVALNQYGYRRFTEDIDLLLKPEGLEQFRQELMGLGYRPAFEGARRQFRSTSDNIRVEIITSGEFPGDGRPKPVQFPDPTEAATEIDGIKTITIEKLVELKLASGMTAPHRLRDLADVQELIKARKLEADFADRLDPSVRKQFLELHGAASHAPATE